MGPSSCGTHEEATFWINSEICGLFCGVTVVYGLIAFAMYTFTFCVIDPWFGITSWKGIINVLLFNFLNALSIYSHFKGLLLSLTMQCLFFKKSLFLGMTTDPGAVPNNARPLLSDCDENDYEAQDKVNGNKFKKFCKKCNAFKPKRAHHCSICRRCIIKVAFNIYSIHLHFCLISYVAENHAFRWTTTVSSVYLTLFCSFL